jgi:5-methylcytosine-specific restriction endonuclease McrA
MIKILALSEQQLPKSFTSLNDICKKWQQTLIGENSLKVKESISLYGDLYISTLERVKKYMDHYVQQGLCNNKTRDNRLPILFIITRSAALIKSLPIFTRNLSNLYNHFKKIIIDGNIQETLKCQNRNAQFQKSLLSYIDDIIRTEIETSETEPRLFTKEQILEKKESQNNLCALCKKLIEPQQHFDGDHIISWSSGGKTIPSNLQVVHRSCHHKK